MTQNEGAGDPCKRRKQITYNDLQLAGKNTPNGGEKQTSGVEQTFKSGRKWAK